MSAPMHTAFQGELMLAGWSESHTGGAKVTFWLSDPADLDAFRVMTCRKGNTAGQRFAAVLVEIGDDEQPINQTVIPNSEPLESNYVFRDSEIVALDDSTEKPKGGALAKWAGILCADKEFRHWFRQKYNASAKDEASCAEAIRRYCIIKSRAELDHDEHAGRRFRGLMAEFSAYQNERETA